MLTFTFESRFETRAELEKELERLLWKVKHTWPMNINCPNKSRTDEEVVKLNGGHRKQELKP